MDIVCCGCDRVYNLVQNIYEMETKPSKLTYYTRCPYCNYKHKIEVTKDDKH